MMGVVMKKKDDDDEIFKSMNKVTGGDSQWFWGLAAGVLFIIALAFCQALSR
jgi:hypothetical protein